MSRRKIITTNTGHELSVKEDKFISLYLELGNGQQACIKAGFKSKNPEAYAYRMLGKTYILDEIRYRRDKAYAKSQATSAEVMDFFARVMRGEVKDQFGLETPVSDRLKAADALAKRTVDIDNRMAGKKDMQTPEVAIKLDWTRNKNMEEKNDGK